MDLHFSPNKGLVFHICFSSRACYSHFNELPKHIKWRGNGESSLLKRTASIGPHCIVACETPNTVTVLVTPAMSARLITTKQKSRLHPGCVYDTQHFSLLPLALLAYRKVHNRYCHNLPYIFVQYLSLLGHSALLKAEQLMAISLLTAMCLHSLINVCSTQGGSGLI